LTANHVEGLNLTVSSPPPPPFEQLHLFGLGKFCFVVGRGERSI
jgi:hypothetical protein